MSVDEFIKTNQSIIIEIRERDLSGAGGRDKTFWLWAPQFNKWIAEFTDEDSLKLFKEYLWNYKGRESDGKL